MSIAPPLVLLVEDFDDAREMYADYLEFSGFLADINSERKGQRNKTYKSNLASMEGGLVLYLFDDDETVIPKESSWFAEVEAEEDDNQSPNRNITWLRDRKMYQDDWLGLKELDEQGKIKFLKTPGRHVCSQSASSCCRFAAASGLLTLLSYFVDGNHRPAPHRDLREAPLAARRH